MWDEISGRRKLCRPHIGASAEKLPRYALHSGVDLIIVGCSSPEEVRDLSRAAMLPPMNRQESFELEELFTPRAKNPAFYRGNL